MLITSQTGLFSEKESQYQAKVLGWLKASPLNYKYLGRFQYAKGKDCLQSGEKNSPLIEEELVKFLQNQQHCTDMQVADVIKQVKDNIRLAYKDFGTLADTNSAFYQKMIYGIKSKPSETENENDVMLFDFTNPNNNYFAVAEEVSFIDPITGYNARPDIVVYVNGIALAVIELKRSLVSLDEGIAQHLSNERDLIPSFFTTTQFTIAASENNGFKYATIGTPMKFWCPYKKDTTQTGIKMTDEESFKAFFARETFIRMFRYGVITDGGVKKVMRPHQFHALTAAIPRLEKKESGVIWHSQGSGKTLTMIWLALYIKSNFPDPRVIVITDRTELDKQLVGNFSKTENSIYRAKSGKDLLEKLNSGSEWIISTLIHKFGSNAEQEDSIDENNIKIPLDKYLENLKVIIAKEYPTGFRVKGDNIFVFIDECHRTQGGRLHEAMREIMGKEVMLIGFTGTPLLKNDKITDISKRLTRTSEYRIGPFIHKYLHKQAIEDKVINDLQYEARDVEQEITKKDKLDEAFDKLVAAGNLNEEKTYLLKSRWSTLEKVYSSKERIERIGYSILDDMENNPLLTQDWCNAMLIAGNIYSAYKYYDFFQNRCGNTILKGRCAVVTSYEPSSYDMRKETTNIAKESEMKFKHDMALKSFEDANMPNAEKYEAWAKDRFIHQPGNMKLLIVVDKLLTGFDAPNATFLYIDKTIEDHTLFQAICRVNRLGEDFKDENGKIVKSHKEFGQIVDFKHLFSSISDAVTKFNDENGGFKNYDEEDIEGLLSDAIVANKKRLNAALLAYKSQKSLWERSGLDNEDSLLKYFITDEGLITAKEKRSQLYEINSALVSSYSNLADNLGRAGYTPEESAEIEDFAREAARITLRVKEKSGDNFDPRQFDPDMRSLLDRFIRAEDADTIVPADTDFSFLDLLDSDSDTDEAVKKAVKAAGGRKKAAAEKIEGKARSVINNAKEKDPQLAQTFSERLDKILGMIKESTDEFETKSKDLINLLKVMKGGGKTYPAGINNARSKALWNNRTDWCPEMSDEKILARIKKIDEHVEYDSGRDYRDRFSTDGQMLLEDFQEDYPELTDEQIMHLYTLIANN